MTPDKEYITGHRIGMQVGSNNMYDTLTEAVRHEIRGYESLLEDEVDEEEVRQLKGIKSALQDLLGYMEGKR